MDIERELNRHPVARSLRQENRFSFSQAGLEIETRKRVGDRLCPLFPNPHDPESPLFLLKAIEVGIELER